GYISSHHGRREVAARRHSYAIHCGVLNIQHRRHAEVEALRPLLYRLSYTRTKKPPCPWSGVGGVLRVNALSTPPERGYAGHAARTQPLRVDDRLPQHFRSP